MLPFVPRTVRLLERLFPAAASTLAAPRYLHEASLELADTAIEAVRKETLHLFDNAFELLAHGLSLHRTELRSGRDLEELASRSGSPIPVNFDLDYEARIKGLYAAIVEFVSRSHREMTTEQAEELFVLRTAGQELIEAIKATKHMHKNLVRFVQSDDPILQAEYAHIRAQLGEVLRAVLEVREAEGEAGAALTLDAVRLDLEDPRGAGETRVDRLIRDGKISSKDATSLLKDLAYARDIGERLLTVGEALIGPGELEDRQAARGLALDEDELADLNLDDEDEESDAGGAPDPKGAP